MPTQLKGLEAAIREITKVDPGPFRVTFIVERSGRYGSSPGQVVVKDFSMVADPGPLTRKVNRG